MNDKEFLSYFDGLNESKAQDSSLLEAIKSIIETLVSCEKETSSKKDINKNSLVFGSPISPDLEYTLVKAIKSLCSSDVKVQFHYALLLTEILIKFESLKSQNILDLILKECNIKNSVSKGETSHFIIGKFMGLNALIQCRKIENENLYTYFAEIILDDISKHPKFEEFGIKILENSLEKTKDKKLANMKIKVLCAKLKGTYSQEKFHFLKLLISIRNFARKTLKSSEFPLKKQMEQCLLDYNKLLHLLIQSLENFPQESYLIKGVIEFISDYIDEQGEGQEYWTSFFEYFIKELSQNEGGNTNFDYKKIFLLLALFRRCLKLKDFNVGKLKQTAFEKIVSIWLKNLNVQNETLRNLSRKIEKRIVNLFENCEKNNDNCKEILNFVCLMKNSTYYHFTSTSPIAKIFFETVLNEELIPVYWSFLKKKAHKATDIQSKLFLLSEILHFFSWKLTIMPEELLLEAVIFTFKEISEEKIIKLLETNEENDEELLEENTKKYYEKAYDYFYSLLNELGKRPSKQFEKRKSAVWKGMSHENIPLLCIILEKCTLVENPNDLNKEKRKDYVSRIMSSSKEVQKEIMNIESDMEKSEIKRNLSFLNLLASVGLMSFQFSEESFQTLQELFQVKEEREKEIYGGKLKKRKLNNGEEKNVTKEKWNHVLFDILVSLLSKSPSNNKIYF